MSKLSPKLLQVKNPHSVLAALKCRPQDVDSIFISDNPQDTWKQIAALGSELRIRFAKGIENTGQRSSGSRGGGHAPFKGKNRVEISSVQQKESKDFGRVGTSYAMIKPKAPVDLDTFFNAASDFPANSYGVWLALDCIQDPQNLGSIFRSAAFFGIKGVVLTSERSADLTEVVYDVSCGGVEALSFVQVGSFQHVLKVAKKNDIWVLGTSEHAKDSLFNLKKDRNWLLVLGNEEKGLRRLTAENCDLLCSIPALNTRDVGVGSLNVAVAAGISFAHFASQK